VASNVDISNIPVRS
jgi:tRNA G18 (ribose-2'-O)-methylase SpoU